jgi:branched-chain amino acid transport system substrate-binding protein
VTATATDIPGIAEFNEKFVAQFKRNPTHDAIKGYVGAWATKYVTEKVGEFSGAKFAETMKNLCLKVADHPRMLLDTCWDDAGEMSRPSFMVQVKDGKPVVIGTVPAN